MPQIKSHAGVFRDWDAVLGAATQNATLLPGVDPLKSDLEGLLAQAKDLKIQQKTMEAHRKGATQSLKKVIKVGRESVRKLRAFAVVHLGSDNEMLTQFGVAVRVGKSSHKSKAPGTPPPTVPPTAGTPQPPAHNQAESTQTQGKDGTHV